MKNDKKLFKSVVILLLVVMVALVLVSGTYAKYTTTVSGTDTAIVAKWAVKAAAGSTDFTSGTAATVNIFDESNVYDTKSGFTTGTVDDNVKNATSGADAIIAPGTWGKFSYTLTNNSDVDATYTVAYNADEKNVPLMWSLTGAADSWKDNISDLNVTAVADPDTDDSTTLDMTTGTETITVYWKWDFTKDAARDTADTTLGTAATLAKPTATVTVTFTQVD